VAVETIDKPTKAIIKKVNTTNPLVTTDEDRRTVRSDVGKNMTEQIRQTTAKYKLTKKEQLLANPDIKRWYDNIARGSPLTAEVRLRRISHFCEIANTTPIQLADLASKDLRAATDLILDHVSWMEKHGRTPGYTENTVTAIKSWLRHFDIEIKRRIKVNNPDSTPTLANERVPDKKEITELFDRTSLRTAAAISLIAKAGLRPQVLGNHNGTDGLVIRDIPDLTVEEKSVEAINLLRIMVRPTLSKARHQYFTFLTENGTRKLLAYLNERLARGERLGPDSAIIAPDTNYKVYRGKNAEKKFLPTSRITRDIRDAFRPRFRWRPYILRAYFDTQLLMAESRGKIAHDFRVFFMGHKGSIESRYTTNKGILPNALVEEMRSAFKRSQEFLDLETNTENIPEIQIQGNSEFARFGSATTQSVQIITRLDQVEEMMSKGWRLVATLPADKAVLEKNGFG
jgi:hypothetical protein